MDLGPDVQARRQSDAVMTGVANLVQKLGYPPEVVFEGAVKGAAVAMLATGCSADTTATLLERIAWGLREEGDRADGSSPH